MLALCLAADAWLIYGVVFSHASSPPWKHVVLLGQVNLSRMQSWALHTPGDNYRVICVLTLSALTILVSSLWAGCLQLEVDQSAAEYWGISTSYLCLLWGRVLSSCVCWRGASAPLFTDICGFIYISGLAQTQLTLSFSSSWSRTIINLAPPNDTSSLRLDPTAVCFLGHDDTF